MENYMAALILSILMVSTNIFNYDASIAVDPIKVDITSLYDHTINQSEYQLSGLSTNLLAFTSLMDWGWCGNGGPGTSGCGISIGLISCQIDCREGQHACCSFFWGCRCRDDVVADDEPTENESNTPV